jgi:hypothetical protein
MNFSTRRKRPFRLPDGLLQTELLQTEDAAQYSTKWQNFQAKIFRLPVPFAAWLCAFRSEGRRKPTSPCGHLSD